MGLLDGKAAIVSGVGPGMGRDIAVLLAEHGADVVVGARTVERCEKVADEVRALGRRAHAAELDVTDQASCAAAAAACLDAFGRIDVLVNNAYKDGNHRSVEDSALDDWRATMEVNLFGTLQMTRAVIPTMREQADGRIVMINSMSAHHMQERYGAYAASKSALEAATKTLAIELGRHGIRVNGVHPGYIWGAPVQMYFEHQASKRGVTPDDVYREVADTTSLKYIPDSSEIAGAVLFFASDLARAVTGQSLPVNAGAYL
jgi:NAD(P)-dependent dehydrogenase (short-subunit alcohol dehydrogenase family)